MHILFLRPDDNYTKDRLIDEVMESILKTLMQQWEKKQQQYRFANTLLN